MSTLSKEEFPKGQGSMLAYHTGDVFLERLPISVIELLRIILRWLLSTHVVNCSAQLMLRNSKMNSILVNEEIEATLEYHLSNLLPP